LGISHLSLSTAENPSVTPTAFAARGHRSNHIMQATKPTPKYDSSSTTTIGIHHTKDGHKFISHNNILTAACRPNCLLCNNKHANPWHPTENCPYKHPTQILPKDVRKRVMQHSALHGAEKKDYTKDQDLPNSKPSPPQAASAITTTDEYLPVTSTQSIDPPTLEHVESVPVHDEDEIIDTEYFDLPLPAPTANVASVSSTDLYQDLEPDTVNCNPLQYLSYES
jgi:hypothetical protein